MHKNPLISVCLASYNGALWITEQLQSVLAQLPLDAEVLVGDDASSDETVRLIQGFTDPRIRLFCHSKRLGFIKNFEYLLAQCQGEYVFLCDQDDRWMPHKVTKSVEAMRDHLEWELLVHDAVICDADMHTIHPSLLTFLGGLSERNQTFNRNLIRNHFPGACMVLRRRLLLQALPFPQGIPAHDHWMVQLALLRPKGLGILQEALLEYRRTQNNASPTTQGSRRSLCKRLWERLILVSSSWLRSRKSD